MKRFENYSKDENRQVIGLPSGEVITISTIFTFNKLLNDGILHFVDDWVGVSLNMYCYDDRNRDIVFNYINMYDDNF